MTYKMITLTKFKNHRKLYPMFMKFGMKKNHENVDRTKHLNLRIVAIFQERNEMKGGDKGTSATSVRLFLNRKDLKQRR